MRAVLSMLLLSMVAAGCESSSAPAPDPARPGVTGAGATGATPGAPTKTMRAAGGELPAAGGALPASSGGMPAPPPEPVVVSAPGATGDTPAATRLATPKLLAKGDTGGCTLAGLDAKYVYARAPSCTEVLRVDRSSGAVEAKKLPKAMLVELAVDGVAYGCPLGRSSSCKLTRVPLDGGAASEIATLQGFVDTPHAGHGTTLAAVFLPTLPNGSLDGASQQYTIETIELTTGARTVIGGPTGIGSVSLGPKGVLFEGARTPKENVGSASWGLWLYPQAGAEPRLLSDAKDISAVASDERYAYFVGREYNLYRVGFDGTKIELVTGPIGAPEREEGKLGVNPGIRVGQDTVYVSTASTKECWLWAIPKP